MRGYYFDSGFEAVAENAVTGRSSVMVGRQKTIPRPPSPAVVTWSHPLGHPMDERRPPIAPWRTSERAVSARQFRQVSHRLSTRNSTPGMRPLWGARRTMPPLAMHPNKSRRMGTLDTIPQQTHPLSQGGGLPLAAHQPALENLSTGS